ncbi:MAG: polysaccharide biosynthesis transport protein, partial [Candidatus Eremiobacteraeota bacterium]|nr:polysaccharide biosynthesis transport protein [Candidatus Eremiobacteraeota bacterium]
MYEPQRLPGNSIPLATPVNSHRTTDVDPVAMWHSFIGTLVRRRFLFASIVVGVVVAVAVVTLLTPKRYTTGVKMIAGNPNTVAQNPQGAMTGMPVLNALLLSNAAQSAETYAELMSESPVVEKVITDLGLKTDVGTLQGAVRVKPVTNTNIISLQVTWTDPDTSAKIANDFASVFVGRQAELVAGQANGALEFLGKQLPQARARLLAAETAVSRYETSHNIADLGTQTTTTLAAAAGIDQKINAIQLEKQQSDAQIVSLAGQLAGMKATAGGGSSVAQNPVIPQLHSELAQLKIKLGSAQRELTDSHPDVINLKQQISDLSRELKRQPATIVASTSTIANPVYQQLSQQLGIA